MVIQSFLGESDIKVINPFLYNILYVLYCIKFFLFLYSDQNFNLFTCYRSYRYCLLLFVDFKKQFGTMSSVTLGQYNMCLFRLHSYLSTFFTQYRDIPGYPFNNTFFFFSTDFFGIYGLSYNYFVVDSNSCYVFLNLGNHINLFMRLFGLFNISCSMYFKIDYHLIAYFDDFVPFYDYIKKAWPVVKSSFVSCDIDFESLYTIYFELLLLGHFFLNLSISEVMFNLSFYRKEYISGNFDSLVFLQKMAVLFDDLLSFFADNVS